jgi:hypothetical protein
MRSDPDRTGSALLPEWRLNGRVRPRENRNRRLKDSAQEIGRDAVVL